MLYKFSSKDTMFIKGIAIILMVCNHLFPIPEWIYPENQYISIALGSKTAAAYFGGFSKICVALFAFLTGIGLYYTYANRTVRGGYFHTLKKLIPFFLTYWIIILCVYVPIMSAVEVFSFDIKEFILNLFGYETTYCRIAWYVRFYLELILLFPIVILLEKVLHKKLGSPFVSSAIVLICNWVLRIVFLNFSFPGVSYVTEFLNYLPVVLIGYYVAWNSVFEKIARKLSGINMNVLIMCGAYLISFLCLFVIRGVLASNNWINIDVILAPVFIFCSWYFMSSLCGRKAISTIKNVLSFLGRYSLEIWFLHAIFFIGNATVQKIAYWPRLDILILIWSILILIPLAMVVQNLVSLIYKRKG